MNSLSVAAIQLTSTASWQDNLAEVQCLVSAAVDDGARLVVLPENVFLFDGKNMRHLAESNEQDILLKEIALLAKKHSVYLVVGSHPSLCNPEGHVVGDGRVRQSCLVFDPTGLLVERYDKIHLFDVTLDDKAASYQESKFIEPGEVLLKMIEIDGFKVGLSICYDLRFPELYRALAKLGAELLLVPAAFTYVTGKAHWDTLLAARSIENQCYVLGVNQCGWHNQTRQTYGHSTLYSPTGEKLSSLKEVSGYFVADINKQAISDCRIKMPTLSHRRF